jgi:hypothetical protein
MIFKNNGEFIAFTESNVIWLGGLFTLRFHFAVVITHWRLSRLAKQ